MRRLLSLPALFAAALLPRQAHAQVAVADSGDTAWMILCAVLVLVAALPGLILRRAGQTDVRGALSVMGQGLAAAACVSIAWAIVGYSLAYGPGGGWLGGGGNLLLANLGQLRDGLTVPESAFVLFQMALAVLAACLVAGAIGPRAHPGWIVAFSPLWLLIVYAPVARWTWGGGWLAELGAMDFAGALVLHVCGGFSALAIALLAGRGDDGRATAHAPVLTLLGGAFLWIGWAGIMGGWALGATDDAASAILNACLAASAAALVRALIDRLLDGRSSATGIASGALAGLVAISASAPLVGAGGALMIGVIAAALCRAGSAVLASRLDDGGAFAIHGLGGIVGMLLLPIFTLPLMGGVGFDASISVPGLLLSQATGVAVVALWAMAGAAIIALLVSMVIPLRTAETGEPDGRDSMPHGEQEWDNR
ncbi:MAG: ammonium transporter [Sphingobium sp.]